MLTVLAVLFAGLAAYGIFNAMWYSSRPERNALTESDAKHAIERRIDMSYTLTLTSLGACMTLASVAADGPPWSSILGILLTAATMLLLRRLRPDEHQGGTKRNPARPAHAQKTT